MSTSDASLRACQADLARAVKAAAAALADNPGMAAFDETHGVTQTEAAIVASALLDAAEIEIFELAMWQTWGHSGSPGPA